MFHKPFLGKTYICLRKKEIPVFKFCFILGLLFTSSVAHSETQLPWFGSAAATPEQVTLEFSVANRQESSQKDNCAIYSCSSLVKIAMPQQNSSSNP
jgi:hypothetical protein